MLAPSTETGEHEIKLEEDADDLMKIMKMTTKSHDFIVINCFLTSKIYKKLFEKITEKPENRNRKPGVWA
jgi:hypothetical protein